MTEDHNLDRELGSWFAEQASSVPPETLLKRGLERVNLTRQRPGWLAGGVALPRPFAAPAIVPAWVVILLVALAAMAVVAAGARLLLAPSLAIVETSPVPSAFVDTSPVVPRSASWSSIASMPEAHEQAPAILLPDGTVLVVGGLADRYDPLSGTWRSAGRIPEGGSATLLLNGKVLVAGGADDFGLQASAKLYDPSTNTWSATGSMIVARRGQAAIQLADGKVLVAGGVGAGGTYDFLDSAEIYDPNSGTWSATGSMSDARGPLGTCCSGRLQATLLHDDTVLVEGGFGHGLAPWATAELYDPSSGTWSTTGSMATARNGHTATLLADGRVLVVGGSPASAEIYDPGSKTWSATRPAALPGGGHTATLLGDGRVLVAGGTDGSGHPTRSAELFDPGSSTWSTTDPMSTIRSLHAAILLLDGRVLVAGGWTDPYVVASAELYDPGSGT